jgi:hypothetical protein
MKHNRTGISMVVMRLLPVASTTTVLMSDANLSLLNILISTPTSLLVSHSTSLPILRTLTNLLDSLLGLLAFRSRPKTLLPILTFEDDFAQALPRQVLFPMHLLLLQNLDVPYDARAGMAEVIGEYWALGGELAGWECGV